MHWVMYTDSMLFIIKSNSVPFQTRLRNLASPGPQNQATPPAQRDRCRRASKGLNLVSYDQIMPRAAALEYNHPVLAIESLSGG